MDDSLPVYILLGTFNGEKYLHEQIVSIVGQTCPHWLLIIRDDGSQDQTVAIIERWLIKDKRILFLRDQAGNLGAGRNFARLLEYAFQQGADYFVFADQDDVWKEEKLQLQIDNIQKAESSCDPDVPILLHSDLQVVDENLTLIHSSFMGFQNIRHEWHDPLKVLVVQNFVTGCTLIMNRRLAEIALPIPNEALMHDWWLALCAAAFGKIFYVSDALVCYRQHGSNKIGAKGFWEMFYLFISDSSRLWKKGFKNFGRSIQQVKCLKMRMESRNDYAHSHLLSFFARYLEILSLHSPVQRVYLMRKLGVKRQNFFTNLLQSARFFVGKP